MGWQWQWHGAQRVGKEHGFKRFFSTKSGGGFYWIVVISIVVISVAGRDSKNAKEGHGER